MNENTENKTTPISIDGVEYVLENLSDKQRAIIEHLTDMDRKLAIAKFGLDQLQVGRDAFFAMLKQSLAEESNPAAEDIVAK